MKEFSRVRAIVVTHVTISSASSSEVYGQCHAIADFLKQNAKELIFIRHPLEGGYFSRADISGNARVSKIPIINTQKKGILRYGLDTFSTLWAVLGQRGAWDIYIGVNSLNSFAGLLLRLLGKVRRVIFYTADYAPERFSNKFLNEIYHCFDRFCIRQADFVWNISQAQMEIRKKQGVPAYKNIYVPHGIDKRYICPKPLEEIDRNSFVIAANLSKAFNYKLIIDAFKDVVVKIPQAKLIIIGTGVLEDEISDYISLHKLNDHIKMPGLMAHNLLMDFISKCGIGLAVYTSLCSWTNFSDSFKTKEYLGCGCPVIISGALGAIKEAQQSNAIIAVPADSQSLALAMLKLLEDDLLYLRYRENAISFMRGLDWQIIYSRSLSSALPG